MENLFDENTGSKIRYTAIALFIVGSLITIIIGIVNIVDYIKASNAAYSNNPYVTEAVSSAYKGLLWKGLGFMLGGPFVSWIVSLALYGEGVALETQRSSYLLTNRLTNDYFKKNKSN